MEIPVHDTGAVNAYGDGLYQGLANRESYFRVDAKKSSPAGFDLAQAPLADMTVRVTCEWLSHDGKATWLVRSLDQRAKTILKVAREIVRQQDAFLVHGVRHLRPLNLKTVAEAIEMHESTVSRVTSNKYMATQRGIFELKYFFTTAIGSAEGGEAHGEGHGDGHEAGGH